MSADIEARIVEQQSALRRYVAKRAGSLLRYEEIEDLVQGVILRALDRVEGCVFNSPAELRAWLFTLSGHFLSDRRARWHSLKRGGGKLARLTLSGASGEGVPMPAIDQSGPRTRAARRELLVLSTRALAALPARDQELVRWRAEGMSLEEQAKRLGLSYTAVQRAGLRAFERFRKLFELASSRLQG